MNYVVDRTPNFDLNLTKDGDVWIVSDRFTAIHGTGASVLDALNDFRRAARETLDVLDRQENLTPWLATQRDYLRSRIDAA